MKTLTKDNESIYIRAAQTSDGLQMQRLTEEVIKEEDGLIMTMDDFTMTVEQQAEKNGYFLQHPKAITLVAERNRQIIGILTIEPQFLMKTAHRGTLGLIVKKFFRSQGIGKALMIQAIRWAKIDGQYEKLELEVLENNLQAISLYKRLGFELEGVKLCGVKHDNTYENLHQMGLFLK
nr:GNAT family N-acetyltransferase [Evansella caseinilytica]